MTTVLYPHQDGIDKIIYTRNTLWIDYAPHFAFELNEDELLELAINRGFVTKIGEDEYLANPNYAMKERD